MKKPDNVPVAEIFAGADAISALTEVVRAYVDHIKVAEEAKAKRTQIEAWRTVQVERLRSQREILLRYLDRSFDERQKNFESFFQALDLTIANGEAKQASQILASIVDLAKSCPFQNIKQEVQDFLADPSAEMELEF